MKKNLKPKHILLAEDDELGRKTLAHYFRKNGYEVTTVANGREALDLLSKPQKKREEFSLLVTDHKMPVMTGFTLIEELKAKNISVPALMITAFGDKDIVLKLMRLGCNDFIPKPFEIETLLAAVERILHESDKKKKKVRKEIEKIQAKNNLLKKELEEYRKSFEALSFDIVSAADTYANIVKLDPQKCKVPLAYHFLPLSWSGGDFFGFANTHTGCDIFTANIAGNDMGASYHAVLLKAFFEANSRRGKSGRSFLRLLNHQLIAVQQSRRVISALFCRLDLETMQGELVSAGQPPVIHVSADKKMSILAKEAEERKNVLGVKPYLALKTHRFSIKPGERLILYSSGITEPVSEKYIKFTKIKLYSEIKENLHHPLQKMIDNIWDVIQRFKCNAPTEDILLLGLEIPDIKK